VIARILLTNFSTQSSVPEAFREQNVGLQGSDYANAAVEVLTPKDYCCSDARPVSDPDDNPVHANRANHVGGAFSISRPTRDLSSGTPLGIGSNFFWENIGRSPMELSRAIIAPNHPFSGPYDRYSRLLQKFLGLYYRSICKCVVDSTLIDHLTDGEVCQRGNRKSC
jgi:hypothetical protein